MSEFLKRISKLSRERLALLVAEMQQRLERAERAQARAAEPIAIVGLGCRFPGGADSPAAFWKVLADGVDAVREVPDERWDLDVLYDPDPLRPGTVGTRWGGFLDDVDLFDPKFFGISPREALTLDPQQRLLLEVAWEALEHAGQRADRLVGSATGVFVGLCNKDYHELMLEHPLESIDSYFASGTAGSMASGRISYLLGLQGPSFTVDTACSSSLVALHLACESLRSGECRMALGAGTNLILGVETMIGLTKAQMLSPTGRCRTFDADADGIVRGEGCGVVVLKRLSDATADGDRVLATIRASAINQDGRSSGITAPNGPAQEALMRRALARAGLAPTDVDFIEAHGTGTTLGDPIEVRALGAVYADGRATDRPLVLGSIKTNFGHLEASAGIAGLIKTVLALQHATLPPHLHLKSRNPLIEWDRWPMEIPTAATPWKARSADGVRRAAVSSFGFSGTNAHIILEEAPAGPGTSAGAPPALLLPLSAKSEEALKESASRMAAALTAPDAPDAADAAFTAGAGRSHFVHRLATVGRDAAELSDALARWVAGDRAPAVHVGRAGADPPEPVFLFTGQGAQYAGMGRELYDGVPIFRETLDRCDALLRETLETPLLDALFPADDADDAARARIDATAYTQPALFAVEYALARLWASWGIRPAAVLGHSVGEYVAATVAGLFSLEDGLALIAERARRMQALPEGGGMAAVFGGLDAVERAVEAERAARPAALSVAAVNGPDNIVVAGDLDALDRLIERLAADGVKAKRLVVSHAFHSARMDPMLDAFEGFAGSRSFGTPTVPVVSNRTGEFAGPGEMANGTYWRDHVRQPVRFLDGMRALAREGHRLFVEIGPQPTLCGMGAKCLPDLEATWLPSLRKGRPDAAQLGAALAELYVRGAEPDWANVSGGRRRKVALPTYPFRRDSYWIGWSERAHGRGRGAGSAAAASGPGADWRDWLWRIDWSEAGAPGAGRLAAPAAVRASLEPGVRERLRDSGADVYADYLPRLDAMSTAYILRALRAMGCDLARGERLEEPALRRKLGVKEPHRRLFHRMLAILEEDGILRRDDEGGFTVVEARDADPEEIRRELGAKFPECESETSMTQRCAADLPGVLRGEVDPMGLLFPGGSLESAEGLYAEAPAFRLFNGLVRDTIARAVGTDSDAPLRVLEIGGGTGGVTGYVLPVLPVERTRYVFTDVSPAFLTKARAKFAAYPFVEYRTFDASRDADGQGFEAGGFDLVLASNVLHATPDLRATLGRTRDLLAPGGMLVVLEGVLPQRFGDLTVGLTEGWWNFTDTDLRPAYALMPAARWISTLEQVGFEQATAFPEPPEGDRGALAQQAVLIAKRPEAAAPAAPDGRWLAVAAPGGRAAAVAAALAVEGVDVTTVAPDEAPAALRAQSAAPGGLAGVIVLAALDEGLETDPALLIEGQRRLCSAALTTTQAVLEVGPAAGRLVLVSAGAQPARADEPTDPTGASLVGFSRVAALEHPELRPLSIDLHPAGAVDGTDGDAANGIALALARQAEGEIAVRDGALLAPRVVRHAARGDAAADLDPEGAYLVTGGLAGIGLRLAEKLAARGAGTLILAARSEPTAAAREACARMVAAGARVEILRGDVADPAAVRRMVEAAGDAPLRGVYHCAGITDDAAIPGLDWPRIERVMAAKVQGSWNLHRATRDAPLDRFALFSSGASFLGSAGQANHAAANAWMDALAHRRRAAGLPALSVNWGAWSELGAALRGDTMERVRTHGLAPIDPDSGLAILDALLDGAAAQVAALPIDWAVWLPRSPVGGSHRFDAVRPTPGSAAGSAVGSTAGSAAAGPGFAVPGETGSTGGGSGATAAGALAAKVRDAAPGRRRDLLIDGLADQAARVLALGSGEEIDPSIPLSELGLDSLMAVELRNAIGAAVDRALPATLLFNYPTVEELAAFLEGELAGGAGADAPVAPAVRPAPTATTSRDPAPPERERDLDDMSEDEMADLLEDKLRDA